MESIEKVAEWTPETDASNCFWRSVASVSETHDVPTANFVGSEA